MTADLLRKAADRLELFHEHAEYPSPWDVPLAAWLRLEAEVITSDQNPERLAAVTVARAILGDDA